jgi:hypothetical protein
MAKYRSFFRWLTPILAVGCVLATSCVLLFAWPSFTRQPVGPARATLPETVEGPAPSESDPDVWYEFGRSFVGYTKADITERFGPPTDTWRGHYGRPRLSKVRTYPEAVTLVYQRASGSLYLSFCCEKGRWVCFSAQWMTKDSVF